MGQRHMSYVITQNKYKETAVNTIYNQWNYRKLEAIKLERAIKLLNKIDSSCESLFKTYFSAHGLSPQVGWNGGNIEDENFKDGTYSDCFQEDNNNGWTIIKLIQGEDYKIKVEICFVLGSEDGGDYTKNIPVSPDKFFKGESNVKEDYYEIVKYICENTTYNSKLKAEAVKLIKQQLINQKQLA